MSPRSRRAARGCGAAARRERRPRSPRVRGRRVPPPPQADRRECRDGHFSAASIAARLRASPSSSTPVPRPAQRAAPPPSRAAHSIAAVVVFAIPISPTASRSQSSGTVRHPAFDRREKFVRIHRRGFREIARRPVEFDRHHAQLGAGQFGDLVDGRAACGKIRHHLRGDGRRKGRDAARGDAVIAGEHRDRDAIEPRQFAPLPFRQPDRQFFETAEAARRLCQVLLPPCGEFSDRRSPSGRSRQKVRMSSRLSNGMRFSFCSFKRSGSNRGRTLDQFSGHHHE